VKEERFPVVDPLLEQYKLYVEMAGRVTEQRMQTNKFYISLLSGLLALLSVVGGLEGLNQPLIFGLVSLLGISLCFVWYLHIQSYRQLSEAKFEVIHELEQKLPFPCYDREWEVLEKRRGERYFQLTRIEKIVPLILSLPFIFLLLYVLSGVL